jgi:hypothetical protein
MGTKRKTCDIPTWGKNHLFLEISPTNIDTLVSSLYSSSFDCCLSHFFTWSSTIWYFRTSLREFLDPVVNCFTRQTLPTVNRKPLLVSSVSSPFAHKGRKTPLLFGSTLLEHGRRFDYWNQPLNMLIHFCYLDCHAVGLCCYLVIYIEKLLHQLQVIYFHLCRISWLSLVDVSKVKFTLQRCFSPHV